MLAWIWWIIVGGVAGILAKMLVPGSKGEPSGCLFTILLGIAGSLLVGFAMHTLLGTNGGGGLVGSIIGAPIGAVVLILLFKNFWSK
ncbi:MAG: GlsB/YeaQ/YmgE family stress response membrane protein [Fimbriimonadaceae bacterium]|nr:GlsB/YeaQ/YmgE family stress response membrane protein [Fimbriimonadaceae bacterium]